MSIEKDIAKTIKSFGVEWCLQGVFNNNEELEKCKTNWTDIGHRAMVKKGNILYVTRFRR